MHKNSFIHCFLFLNFSLVRVPIILERTKIFVSFRFPWYLKLASEYCILYPNNKLPTIFWCHGSFLSWEKAIFLFFRNIQILIQFIFNFECNLTDNVNHLKFENHFIDTKILLKMCSTCLTYYYCYSTFSYDYKHQNVVRQTGKIITDNKFSIFPCSVRLISTIL